MTAPRIDLAVFDMAGTTIDEGLRVYQVLADTARAHGADPTDEDINRWHGAAKHEALKALLIDNEGIPPEPDRLALVVEDFRRRLQTAYAAQPPTPLPGVLDAMTQLREAGIKVVLNTGFDHDIVGLLLGAIGWEGDTIVDGVVCGTDVPQGRPAPFMIFRAMELAGVSDRSRVLAAGDTPRDLAAGVNAGVGYVVGVLSGAGTAQELGSHQHTHLLRSVADVPALVSAMTLEQAR
ncbi:phosphonatase-like hydrolase [Streptomyces sp. NPDC059426]|uniref:phosphonatase-like hydrolase n=1 Tax=Streptomyces sp. NPDC059426 TaxID=3346827 RepID=UPI0036ACFC4E